jgi:hypothetical protein
MSDDPKSVTDILDRLKEVGEKEEKVSIGDMVEAFGSRSYGPFLMVPAIIEETPVGAIPGVPTAIALIIASFAVQILFGRKHLWLPEFIKRRTIKAETLEKTSDKLRGLARFLDRWFHGRLERLTQGPFLKAAAVIVILLCCTVPPLELLPFASSVPMAAIAMFGLALLVRDGALMVVALLLSVAAVAVGIGMWGSGAGQGG